MEFDIGLVPYAHVIGKPFFAFELCLCNQCERQVSALCQEGDIPLWHIPQAYEIQVVFQVHHAVGVGAEYVKFGAPARGERVAKYNRLLEIEQILNYYKNNK